MLYLLIDQRILHARQENMHEFTCTISEMKSLIGFLLFTGYHKFSQEKLYWSLEPDCNTAIMHQATNLLIDEQMTPYRGRHSARMFCKGKPIRFGYKA